MLWSSQKRIQNSCLEETQQAARKLKDSLMKSQKKKKQDQNENFPKEIEMNQTEILELKNSIYEMKNEVESAVEQSKWKTEQVR